MLAFVPIKIYSLAVITHVRNLKLKVCLSEADHAQLELRLEFGTFTLSVNFIFHLDSDLSLLKLINNS